MGSFLLCSWAHHRQELLDCIVNIHCKPEVWRRLVRAVCRASHVFVLPSPALDGEQRLYVSLGIAGYAAVVIYFWIQGISTYDMGRAALQPLP